MMKYMESDFKSSVLFPILSEKPSKCRESTNITEWMTKEKTTPYTKTLSHIKRNHPQEIQTNNIFTSDLENPNYKHKINT